VNKVVLPLNYSKVTGRRRLSYENPSKYWGMKREDWKPEAKLARLSWKGDTSRTLTHAVKLFHLLSQAR